MNNLLNRIHSILRQDSGENSIMQTISIAVSAILIAAGLITAPSLINNARDTNAKSDLASIAYSEEFFNSTNGSYAGIAATAGATGSEIYTLEQFTDGAGASTPEEGNVKTTFSSGNKVAIKKSTTVGYVAIIQSASGNYFSRNGNSTSITNLGDETQPATVDGATFVTADYLTIP